jgi:hypothetical protein
VAPLLLLLLDVNISASTETLNFLCDRCELISFIKLTKNCDFGNLYNKPGCYVVSKAFSMSKNKYCSRVHAVDKI